MQKIELIKLYKTKSALIIDDFPDMRGSIRRMINGFGIEDVDTASTGEEAIEKCRDRQFDIILADYNLGEAKNGQQILEEMRYENLLRYTSLYVMITAETTKDMVFGALEYQPDDYLTKPFTQTVLQKRLDRLILEKEALFEINEALDWREYDKAIALCKRKIAENDKYRGRCLRVLGTCLLKKHDYEQAKKMHEEVLEERPLEWASIGLGKALLNLNELDEAEGVFEKLVDDGCLCLEAYDCLAEVKNRKGEIKEAQHLLERAIEVSPNAIVRQQNLAQLSEDNFDWSTAEKARRKVVKLGSHSVYESPEHYFNVARCISSQMRHSDEPVGKKRIKEAEEVLKMAKRKYGTQQDVKLQSDIINAGVYADAGQMDECKSRMGELQERMEKSGASSPAMVMDMARTLQSTGDHKKAKELLKDLAAKHEGDESICAEIDKISDEPMSKKGQEKAVQLNKEGKTLFADENFGKAITLFSEALRLYPNNVALNLNMLLALVKEMNAHGTNDIYIAKCHKAIEKIKHIEEDHPQYDRFMTLCNHVEKFNA